MKMIIGGILSAVVLAAAAGSLFWWNQEPVYQAQPLPGVRVGDPGHNLVGPNWSGQPPRNSEENRGPGPEVSQADAGRA